MYALARDYFAGHGDLNVPSNYVTPSGARLGAWINRQRMIRAGKKSGTLSEQRVRALDALGMSWTDLGETRWERNFAALCAYYEQHGDIDVPQDYVTGDGMALGKFVKNMRFYADTKYRRCLTPERIRLLDEMGMIWDVNEYRWQQHYLAAQAYFRAQGDLAATRRYTTPDGVRLGAWLVYQRAKRSRGELDADKIARLDALGMVW